MTTGRQPSIETGGGAFPAIGLGTWKMTGRTCREAVRVGIEEGYRHIDSAQMYDNEKAVGEGIKDAGIDREELFVTTKLFTDSLSSGAVRKATEQSLRRMQTEYLDLLLIHWPSSDVPLEETLTAMHEARGKELVRHVGVSNFPTDLLKEAIEVSPGPIFCDQVEYHPYLSQAPLAQLCRSRDVALVAYSPLARGKAVEDEQLAEIGRRHGKSAAQAALRWLLQQDMVGLIPKASKREHIKANLDILDFELTDDEMAAIDALARGERLIDPDWSPDWD